MEIERKWLVDKAKVSELLLKGAGLHRERLEQYYLKRDNKEIKNSNSNSNLNKNWIESEADEVFSDSNRLLLEKLKKLGFQNDKTSNVKIIEISKMLIFFLFIMNILL